VANLIKWSAVKPQPELLPHLNAYIKALRDYEMASERKANRERAIKWNEDHKDELKDE